MSFGSGSHLCYGAIVIAIVVTRTHEQWIQLGVEGEGAVLDQQV